MLRVVWLKEQRKVEEDGRLMPEFADVEERELFEALNLELESDMDVDRMRHYEVVYLIHEDHKDEVENVNTKVREFLKEKKGKLWRFSDWGMRRLAYKIHKAKNAHYILMNFEITIVFKLFQQLGGGWCNNATTCLARTETRLGSSKKMVKQLAFSRIFSNRPQFNPDFYNWNRVKVRYFDGASFTGDVEAVDPATNLHYRGARVFVAIVEDLLEKGMTNAQNG